MQKSYFCINDLFIFVRHTAICLEKNENQTRKHWQNRSTCTMDNIYIYVDSRYKCQSFIGIYWLFK